MNNLENLLNEYKKISLMLVQAIEHEEYDTVNEHLNSRQTLIDTINNLSYTKEDFMLCIMNLDLISLEEKLNILLTQKKKILKLELDKVNKQKNTNNSYNKNFYANSKIFSKKV